jgi:hypothetical protein
MTTKSFAKLAGAIVTLVAITLAGMSIKAPHAHANDDDDDSRIQIGFQIAPVPLNLEGRDNQGESGTRQLPGQRHWRLQWVPQ